MTGRIVDSTSSVRTAMAVGPVVVALAAATFLLAAVGRSGKQGGALPQ